MKIKTVTKHVTSDGMSFDTYSDALNHENAIGNSVERNYERYLSRQGFAPDDPSLDDDGYWHLVDHAGRSKYYKGKFRDVIRMAVMLSGFWEYDKPSPIRTIYFIEATPKPVKDHPNCREWLKNNGKPYPRYSCNECGSLLSLDLKCRHDIDV